MKISYNWLKQFIKVDWDAKKTGNLLTDLGLEIEGIEAFESVIGGLKGIVVGHVLECDQHPNADRLKVTSVDIGNGEVVQIVCGAPNVAKGQKVPVATIGTVLYDEDGNPSKIKKGKIRGEESHGMICAEDELGLGKSHDGIMILDKNIVAGTLGSDIFEIENDQVFEIGLTPNRADAMSHLGVARDLKAGLVRNELLLELITPSNSSFRVENRTHKIDVQVKDTNLAPRYCGVTISGIKVKESPKWIQNRLKSIGLVPINNIVDATNYVLHELGQPLHAFDSGKISGDKIIVKTVAKGTKFITLDGIERELHKDDLMICDAEKPMCIAGVFGGIESGVTESTENIFLESAYFNPISIRKTAKRHSLNTDASFRFERGIDPNLTEYALMRAALLIKEIAGGKITSDVVDIYPKKIEDHQVFLNFDNASSLIGEEIPKEIIKEILTSLDIKINNVTEAGLGMTIPAYRNDVTREADVIEEILRVYGYNNIKFTEKLNASISANELIEDYQIQNKIGNQLTALGFHEMIGNSLTSPKYIDLSKALKQEHNIEILNPLSNDLSVMRQSMLFNALEVLSFNSNRKISDFKLFEFGKTYHQYDAGCQEPKHLSLLVSGLKNYENWALASSKSTFFYFKGFIINILDRLGIPNYSENGTKDGNFSEGLSFSKNGKLLVDFGIINKSITATFGIDTETFYADFKWNEVLAEIATDNFKLKAIPKFPKVKRDLALLIDESITFDSLKETAQKTERQLLKNINLFDVYKGSKLPEGKKSYALSFTLQDDKRTLTDKQIDKIMKKLQQNFESEFGASLR
ncbi:MAG: phenylalanine--tRNA ligase subunit beta [Flavobacteriaceae bacterium]|jgi:phenylalanyl-tRNA synthetase beta chain|nr:phenylalanine--tRNA ligase subunit beta [Flavobacteriaceae bacterium]MBT3919248.1 phenylalanine--tRNA ligase subunit beta [Flavobacteriaceae bacterium]MBT6705216.1 phenylalanine--tRNA ligase subunit beta [Flavobacteriaceae bacterium]